jgi:molybdate transport system substrate-binding protein
MEITPARPRMRCARVPILIIALLVATFAWPASAAEVRVYAAASLKESLDEQVRQFETRTGSHVIVSYGASNALARQIDAGAPADLFVSADLEWMDYLQQRRRLASGSRVLLRNTLVLIAPKTSTVTVDLVPGTSLAAALGDGKLAMANPDSVPAGKYGKAALVTLGAWPAVERQVARAENVRAALVLVARGEAPLGIVYRTDALAEPGVRLVGTFPANSHPPIVYPAAVIAGSSAPVVAAALLDALGAASARAVWEMHGFVVAP